MIALSPLAAFVAGALLLLLAAGGAAMLFLGLRARAEAAEGMAARDRLAGLLGAAPALAMTVRADGRVEMPQRLADWLGFAEPPRYLAELAGDGAGLDAGDAATLAKDVAAAQRAGREFERTVRPAGSARTLTMRGHRAARPVTCASGSSPPATARRRSRG